MVGRLVEAPCEIGDEPVEEMTHFPQWIRRLKSILVGPGALRVSGKTPTDAQHEEVIGVVGIQFDGLREVTNPAGNVPTLAGNQPQ